ncbi:iron complex transport system permease protein [Parageobacillus thermantarcticus]|uniref:Iron complex transport system permease protein n=1 Tax=Parageobacillus thermantarcticus TaxID=186116 RepID=A0A1I0T7F1_9BACL|nr:ABC transporter permease [Parageobacillus thermantarcticus]SFA47617.1 iron complex transport system permease protein [Parageobacillus thermantarcticus]
MKKLFILFVILAVASLFIGVQHISLADLLAWKEDDIEVLMISRIPRLISIIIAGASMSVCGLIMQQLSQNKFVSPTTAGTMDCARLGILVSLIWFASASPLLKVTIAFLFAFAGTMIFMRVLERVKYKDAVFIPLVGLMFGNIVSSMTTFFAYKYDLIQSISSWLHGDFSMMMKGRYELLYLSIPLMIVAYMYANRFTIAGMGEEIATNLGLRYRYIVNVGLVIVAATSSLVVLTVGTLPFLGLIIPNIVTLYYGDHLEKVLPLTALSGAVFVLVCDIFGRVIIYPYEIPIGLTVGVIGSGVFLYLLVRRRKRYV